MISETNVDVEIQTFSLNLGISLEQAAKELARERLLSSMYDIAYTQSTQACVMKALTAIEQYKKYEAFWRRKH